MCDFYDTWGTLCYCGYQIVSGNAGRWESSWLGFNHWSITGMWENKTKDQLSSIRPVKFD